MRSCVCYIPFELIELVVKILNVHTFLSCTAVVCLNVLNNHEAIFRWYYFKKLCFSLEASLPKGIPRCFLPQDSPPLHLFVAEINIKITKGSQLSPLSTPCRSHNNKLQCSTVS